MARIDETPHSQVIDDDTLILFALRRYATACGVDGYHARGPMEREELRRRHDRALQLAAEYKRSLDHRDVATRAHRP